MGIISRIKRAVSRILNPSRPVPDAPEPTPCPEPADPRPTTPPPVADPSCRALPPEGVRNVTIEPYHSHCYSIVIPENIANAGIFITMGSMDWKTNQDLLVKKGSKPTKADYDATFRPGAKAIGPIYWHLYTSESNETLNVNNVGPGVYYLYVYNRGAINTGAALAGRYELKANWYKMQAPAQGRR